MSAGLTTVVVIHGKCNGLLFEEGKGGKMVVPASILEYFRLRGGSSMGVCVLCVYMCV